MRTGRRPQPERVHLPGPAVPHRALSPTLVLILSFVLLDAVGALALALPVSSKSGQSTPIVDAFFTATSAVCLTGLVVFDTVSYWSGFGQVVILLLIQLGGLGIMTGSTLLLLLV